MIARSFHLEKVRIKIICYVGLNSARRFTALFAGRVGHLPKNTSLSVVYKISKMISRFQSLSICTCHTLPKEGHKKFQGEVWKQTFYGRGTDIFTGTTQNTAVILGQMKTHVSRPCPLQFLALPLFFIIFYDQRFYEQKPAGVTCKAHNLLLCTHQSNINFHC